MAAGWVSHSVLTGSVYLFAVYSAGQRSVTAAAAGREAPQWGGRLGGWQSASQGQTAVYLQISLPTLLTVVTLCPQPPPAP